jgi:soluble lytic murein transglycosylase-like protein
MCTRIYRSIAWLALITCPVALHAQVKIKVLDDGTQVMYNERRAKRVWTPPPRASILERSAIDGYIETYATRSQLDPELIRAVVQVESAFHPGAESHKGAMGLMQLMPETARRLAVDDPWDPEQNLRGGTTYLRHLLDRFGGRLELALASYNAGPEAVQRYGGIPPYEETRSYVEKVLRIYRNEPGYSVQSNSLLRQGRKTYLSRDANGNYLLTTTRSGDR